MSVAQPVSSWNLRLWPGIVLVLVELFCLFVPIRVAPQSIFHMVTFMGGPILTGLLAILWWTTYARTTRPERIWVPLLFLLPGIGIAALDISSHDSPMLPMIFGLPFVMTLWVVWLTISTPLPKSLRLGALVAIMVAGWATVGAFRMDGADGDMWPALTLRTTPRAEFAVNAELENRKLMKPETPLAESAKPNLDWAEFRGPNRDGIVTGVTLDADWTKNEPKQLWKQKIGPGWGTFAVVGDRLFTQEQRGENEAIVCYNALNGDTIWVHLEKARFYETIAQAGPRATPTIVDGRLYAQGATGILVCLNAENGDPIWKVNIQDDTGGVVPQWGYSSSPLVISGNVIVYTGGPGGKGTSAFDAKSSKLVWSAGKASHSYSSAHRVVFSGVEQVLQLSDYGVESFDPKTGKILWEFVWHVKGMNRVSQPTILGDGELLIGTGVVELGTKRLKVTKSGETWKAEEIWFSSKVQPYFNDGVIYDGHYYGFSSKSFVCMSLADGTIKWDAGAKYGYGQVLLLKDAGQLVVQAVDGKVYLLNATPTEHVEEAKLNALTGKTWNHPVVNRGRLYVRNGEWAACFELKTK